MNSEKVKELKEKLTREKFYEIKDHIVGTQEKNIERFKALEFEDFSEFNEWEKSLFYMGISLFDKGEE